MQGKKGRFKKTWLIGYLFILPTFLAFFVFMGLPIIMGLIISFTDYNGFNQFNFTGVTNYIDLFQDEYFLVSLKNNIIYTAGTVPFIIAISLLLAVILNTKLKALDIFKTLIFFPTISSLVAVGVVWTILFDPVKGVINQALGVFGLHTLPLWLQSTKTALLSIMIVAVWKTVGYYMVMFLGGLKNIPRQLYEAAGIDGAGKVRQFFSITLPMLSPIIFMVTILTIISSFQVYDLIAVMTAGGPGRATNVLVYRIYQEGFNYLRFGYASAMAYFLFALIMIVTLIQFQGQRKWVTYMD
ncbi:ABC transporter permease [Spirochaetia bacterium]|nr:ABC transporter permease [Spirochaetia bacterium]